MFRKYIISFLALAGVFVGVLAAVRSAKVLPAAPPVSEPPQSPYETFVAGAGIVEANTENIAIGTQIAGIVSRIHVAIGSDVKAGDPLFTIDERAQNALVATRRAAVKVSEASLAIANYELKLAESLAAAHIISVEQLDTNHFAVQSAGAQLSQTRADLNSAETDLERLTVRAPVDGRVLQLKTHLGEFAPAGVLQQPLILFGSVTPLNVRVDVDENDAWRVHAGAAATGFLRGNKTIKTPLKFVRFEPYVIPKVSLTGESTERVDTRVLQVIYSFDRGNLPIFVGQQMDIYIDARAPGTNPPPTVAGENSTLPSPAVAGQP